MPVPTAEVKTPPAVMVFAQNAASRGDVDGVAVEGANDVAAFGSGPEADDVVLDAFVGGDALVAYERLGIVLVESTRVIRAGMMATDRTSSVRSRPWANGEDVSPGTA